MTIPIIDGHLDMAMNARRHERDQRLTVAAIRQREAGGVADTRGRCSVSLPELRKGNVVVVLSTLIARCKPWVDPSRQLLRGDIDYPDATIAHSVACGELAYYRLLESLGEVRIIETAAALAQHVTAAKQDQTTRVGVIITIEGADPILDPEQLPTWHQLGVRTLMLAHFGHSRFAAGTPSAEPQHEHETDAPLTDLGVALVQMMDELAMPLDLTHTSDQSFHHAAEVCTGRIYSSHTACRALSDLPRNHTDAQIRMISERGGVVGIPMFAHFLDCKYDYLTDGDNGSVTWKQVANHIDHICQLTGSAAHAAIGSDLDGGFGAEHTPRDLDTIADLQKLGEVLADRGYGDDDIARIMHGNWLRFFQETLPQQDTTDD